MSFEGVEILRKRLDDLSTELEKQVDNIVLVEETDSTHATARRLIESMDEEGQTLGTTVIIADHQDHGQGRGNRRWESPAGGLYLSWLRSGLDSKSIATLPIVAGAAAHAAISAVGVANIRLKWPNDVLVDGRKMAGIIVYARHGDTNWVTVGFGVNLEITPVIADQNALPATSVSEHVDSGDLATWRQSIACTFVGEMDRLLEDPTSAAQIWRGLLMQQPGDTVSIRLANDQIVTGTLIDLSDEGFLRVDSDGTERLITGGDITETP